MSSVAPLLALALQLAPQADTVPLYTNLGDHHYAITTEVPAAQAYFDQGLRLYYAFNHGEAIRSFREAQRLDASCAMCFWGEALAWGPNINLPMDSAAGVAAFAAVRRAESALDDETDLERALIAAQAARYAAAPPADRASLDSAYSTAMADIIRNYPDEHEPAVLYAESLMDLRPWNYWTRERQPQPGIPDALAQLGRVAAADPKHPGACHFYIHAVEAAYPDSAVACAERLAALMPGAGHIVHMPGHIYVRVGRYADAIRANEHAVHADETYIRDQHPAMGMYTLGYYPHNYDFLAFAASMTGQADLSIGSADKIVPLIPAAMLRDPGMTFLQHWITRNLQMRVRFSRWDEILARPAPPARLPHAAGILALRPRPSLRREGRLYSRRSRARARPSGRAGSRAGRLATRVQRIAAGPAHRGRCARWAHRSRARRSRFRRRTAAGGGQPRGFHVLRRAAGVVRPRARGPR